MTEITADFVVNQQNRNPSPAHWKNTYLPILILFHYQSVSTMRRTRPALCQLCWHEGSYSPVNVDNYFKWTVLSSWYSCTCFLYQSLILWLWWVLVCSVLFERTYCRNPGLVLRDRKRNTLRRRLQQLSTMPDVLQQASPRMPLICEKQRWQSCQENFDGVVKKPFTADGTKTQTTLTQTESKTQWKARRRLNHG